MSTDAQTEGTAGPSPETVAAISAIFKENPNAPPAPVQTAAPSPATSQPTTAEPHPVTPQLFAHGEPQPVLPVGSDALTVDGRQPPSSYVTQSRLKEEADRRRAAEQRAYEAELRVARYEGMQAQANRQPVQQQAKPVDPNPLPAQFRSAADFLVADPDGYANWLESRAMHRAQAAVAPKLAAMEAANQKAVWGNDELRARQVYGDAHVEQVKTYVKANSNLSQHFSQFSDPFSRAAEWARNEQMRQAIPNGDINAYNVMIAEQLLASPEFVQAMTARSQPMAQNHAPQFPVGVPPSLSSQPRGAQNQPVMSTQDALKSYFASRHSAAG